MHRNAAETLAILAFSFLLEDAARRDRFLALTGVDPGDLRAAVTRAEFQGAVLDHLSGDEHMLAAFAAQAGVAPQDVERARAVLIGRRWERDEA
jgi:hypothetical protein